MFSSRSLALTMAFSSYAAKACSEATIAGRRFMTWENVIGQLLGIYEHVLQSKDTLRTFPDDTSHAVSRFLTTMVPELMATYSKLGRKFQLPGNPEIRKARPVRLHNP